RRKVAERVDELLELVGAS
ncbi:hypothetical protein, partial [Glutamicibacter creatinolyticus]